jgi:kynurenine formamidase
MSVYNLGNLRVVDLSKSLDPATETRRCHLFRFNTGGPIPDFHTIVDITSHLGTHVECPYHHNDDWPDVTSLPLTAFMGRAQYVNFSDAKPNTYITAKMLDEKLGQRLLEGDIVILDSPFKIPPFTSLTNTEADKRLFVNGDTAVWLRDHKVKCVGFGDGVSIENRNDDVCPFHDILLAENVVFLEVLKNLELLQTNTFFLSYSPLFIKGLDSSPVHAYAIEGIEQFS